MDNISICVENLKNNKETYLIDNWNNRSYRYSPELGYNKVYLKCKGSTEVIRSSHREDIFASLLEADIVTRDEYLHY